MENSSLRRRDVTRHCASAQNSITVLACCRLPFELSITLIYSTSRPHYRTWLKDSVNIPSCFCVLEIIMLRYIRHHFNALSIHCSLLLDLDTYRFTETSKVRQNPSVADIWFVQLLKSFFHIGSNGNRKVLWNAHMKSYPLMLADKQPKLLSDVSKFTKCPHVTAKIQTVFWSDTLFKCNGNNVDASRRVQS